MPNEVNQDNGNCLSQISALECRLNALIVRKRNVVCPPRPAFQRARGAGWVTGDRGDDLMSSPYKRGSISKPGGVGKTITSITTLQIQRLTDNITYNLSMTRL